MFRFSTNNNEYKFSGLGLVLLQFTLFVTALPPFRVTVVSGHTEMLALMMYIFSCMTALWIAVGIMRKWLTAEETCHHPLWLCLFTWTIWQLLATCFANFPVLSWSGLFGVYDSSGRYVAMFLMVMLLYPLWQSEYRRFIILSAGIAIAVQAALHAIFPPNLSLSLPITSWAPSGWPAYTAFIGAYFWLAAVGGGYVKTRKKMLALTLFLLAIFFISHNKTSVVLAAAALFTVIITTSLPHGLRRFFYPGRNWKIISMALCFLPMIIIFIVSESVSFFANSPLENNAIYPYVRERIALNQIAIRAIQHDPARLLVGDGWGTFNDDAFKYLLLDDVEVFHNGVLEPNWFMTDGYVQHSHNQPMETLLATGLPGMLLWYTIPMLIIWYMPRRFFWRVTPMLVALILLCHIWHMLPQCVHYQALMLVVLYSLCIRKKEMPAIKTPHTAYCMVFLSAGILMAWGSFEQFTNLVHADNILPYAMHTKYSDTAESIIKEDLQRGGERWQFAALFFGVNMKKIDGSPKLTPDIVEWLEHFEQQAHEVALDPKSGANIVSMQLKLEDIILSNLHDDLFAKARSTALLNREDAVMQMARVAPLRDDMAAPFLLDLENYTHHDAAKQQAVLKHLLDLAPNHRGALWKLGHLLKATSGHEEEGEAMIRKAISLHAERVYPITDKELESFKP